MNQLPPIDHRMQLKSLKQLSSVVNPRVNLTELRNAEYEAHRLRKIEDLEDQLQLINVMEENSGYPLPQSLSEWRIKIIDALERL